MRRRREDGRCGVSRSADSHLHATLAAALGLHHPGQRSQELGALLVQRHTGGQHRRQLAPRGYDIIGNQHTSGDGLGEEAHEEDGEAA